jgi:peptide/nickel transport system permease protein
VISFALVGLLELRGNVAQEILQEGAADPDAVAVVEAELGLDEPLPVRFGSWLGDIARGDLGNSLLRPNVTVTELINERIWPTLSIVAMGLLIGGTVGIGFGLLSGLKPGGRLDRALSMTSAVMIATPGFVIGMLLVIYFAVRLDWFHPTGYSWPAEDGWWEWLKSIVLPGTALARYVLAARARGVPTHTVVRRHAMRNAMIPTVTVLGFQAAGAIGLAVAIEQVFAIPGIGSLIVQSVTQRDITVVQGTLLVAAFVVAVVNLLVDLTYGWLNPRIRLS